MDAPTIEKVAVVGPWSVHHRWVRLIAILVLGLRVHVTVHQILRLLLLLLGRGHLGCVLLPPLGPVLEPDLERDGKSSALVMGLSVSVVLEPDLERDGKSSALVMGLLVLVVLEPDLERDRKSSALVMGLLVSVVLEPDLERDRKSSALVMGLSERWKE